MKHMLYLIVVFAVWLSVSLTVEAQDSSSENSVTEQAETIAAGTRDKVEEIAKDVDESERAHEVSAGILRPIYALAEYFSFPAFHWIAFALMVAGVVSFALQLVLAKLVVLRKGSISIKAILSDALGLAISLVGLVLTTQAATENSNFAESAAAVLSATAVGGLAGFVFYRWGQSQEVQAADGRRK
ncbi:MAG: hypothetical protein IID46_15710 [Planctomycetes bacterium]|nr:hypothetical protein [Planctomycetota bacterium]